MKKTFLIILPSMIVLFILCSSCPMEEVLPPDAQDGTVTVSIENATDENQKILVTYVYESGETRIADPSRLVATNYERVMNDSASYVLKTADENWQPTETDWIAAGGVKYDVYTYTTADDQNFSYNQSMLDSYYPRSVSVDGDYTIDVAYGGMVSNFLAVDIENAGDQNGKMFYMGVFSDGADPETDEMLAGSLCQIYEGNAYTVAAVPDTGATWESVAETHYDLYLFIDVDNNEWLNGPEDYGYVYGSMHAGDPLDYDQDWDIYWVTDYLSDYLPYGEQLQQPE